MTKTTGKKYAGTGSNPASLAALKAHQVGPGNKLAVGTRTPEQRQNISKGMRRRNEVIAEVITPKKRAKIVASATRQIFRDAYDILRASEPAAAQRIVDIIKTGKDADGLNAARELLDRTRGRPVNRELQVSVNVDPQQMNLQQIEAELARLGPPKT